MRIFETETDAYVAGSEKADELENEMGRCCTFRVLKNQPSGYKVLMVPSIEKDPFHLGAEQNRTIATPQAAIAFLRAACHRSAAGTCYGHCHLRGTDAKASCAYSEIIDVIERMKP